jgi:hypothetical protein
VGAASDPELLRRILRNPCRLCVDPTDTALDFPHGGTSLGLIMDFDIDFEVRYTRILDPASGALTELSRRSVENVKISLLVDGPDWDEDLIAAAFSRSRSMSTYAPTETRLEAATVPYPVAAWRPILVSPVDRRGKALYVRRPVPLLPLGRSVAWARQRKAGLPLIFEPTPNSTGVLGGSDSAAGGPSSPYWQLARLENITL